MTEQLSPPHTVQEQLPTLRVKSGVIKRTAGWVGTRMDAVPRRLDEGAQFFVRAWCDPDNRVPATLLNKRFWVLGLKLALVTILVYGVIDCIYIVDVGQEGVHLRLGRFSHVTQPGLNFKMPYGIDRVTFVNTQFVLQDEFGYRTKIEQGATEVSSEEPIPAPDQGDQEVVDLEAERQEVLNETPPVQLSGHPEFLKAESKMVTGNLNIVDVSWAIQYEVVDSYKYLFRSAEVMRNMRDVGAIAMSRAVGNRNDMEILTHARGALAQDAKSYAQEILDALDVGLLVKEVIIMDVSPPPNTQAAYHHVTSASQEADNLINQAERDYNSAIVKAYGEAEEILNNAHAYHTLVVNRAAGEAARFKSIVTEYKKSPDVTRSRLYLETMEEVFGKVPYTMVDDRVQGVLPILASLKNGPAEPLPPATGFANPIVPASTAPVSAFSPAAHASNTIQSNTAQLFDPAVQVPSGGSPAPMVLGAAGQQQLSPHAPAPDAPHQAVLPAHTQANAQVAKSGWSFFGIW